MFLTDELFPLLLGSFAPFIYAVNEGKESLPTHFVDSQAFEWRNRILTFDLFLVLEQTGKKHWVAEQKTSDYDDANDSSEEVFKKQCQ